MPGQMMTPSGQPGMMQTMPVQQTATASVQPGEVEQFCLENRLDDHAAQAFLGERPSVQRAVMDRGPVAACSNPSAALLGRIKNVRQSERASQFGGFGGFNPTMTGIFPSKGNPKGGLQRGRTPFPGEVEAFLQENNVDDKAKQHFLEEPLDVQAAVI